MAKSVKKPTSTSKLGATAMTLALNVLSSEAVQQQLKRAPQALMDWALDVRSRPSTGRVRAAAQKANPAAYFGQRGLERRFERLERNMGLAFGERGETTRPEIWAAIDELDRSVAIARSMPTVKRKKMHMRIDAQMDELETGLIEALLPKT